MQKRIKVLPDTTIEKAKFLPRKDTLGVDTEVYLAHPATLLAMKSDELIWDEILNDKMVSCQSCGEMLHANFWKYCPFCCKNHQSTSLHLSEPGEKHFPSELH